MAFPSEALSPVPLEGLVDVEKFVALGIGDVDRLVDPVEDRQQLLPRQIEGPGLLLHVGPGSLQNGQSPAQFLQFEGKLLVAFVPVVHQVHPLRSGAVSLDCAVHTISYSAFFLQPFFPRRAIWRIFASNLIRRYLRAAIAKPAT